MTRSNFRPARSAQVLALAAALALSGCGSDAPPEPTGRALFVQHCAACHGENGTGGGPVAASLRTTPPDLTTLASRAGGFDERRVMAVIDGQREVEAHGPRAMPVWGAVFDEELAGERYGSYKALLHTRALTDYLRSIQRAPDEPPPP